MRANWRALHLEPVQRDYRLRLRLGFSLDYDALHAELQDSVLTITIPKKSAVSAIGLVAAEVSSEGGSSPPAIA